MKSAVIVFPASNCDRDAATALEQITGRKPDMIWHGDAEVPDTDLIVLPGGFSYGDYLRCGAMAAQSRIMRDVKDKAEKGVAVLGICNGFQILCESHLLPGALTRNNHLHFICRDQRLRIESSRTVWTAGYQPGAEIVIPVKNGEGRYVADRDTLARLDGDGLVVARYLHGNPNGSVADIAGITNPAGNVVGLMPHPEHAVEALTGPGTDGLGFFTSVLRRLVPA